MPILSVFAVIITILSYISDIDAALAFRPTSPVSKPPVTPNHPPIVNVGPDQSVNESSKVMLVGAAVDPDPNDRLSYSWTQIAGPAVILNDANTATPTFTAPSSILSNTELKFALIVKDDKGIESNNPAILTVTVKHINHPPIAKAGTYNTIKPGYVVPLDGSKSNDPDGDPLTYTWKQIAGPAVMLNGADRSIATFTAPSNISSNTTLAFKLTVRDSNNASNIGTVKVIDVYIPVSNQPPIANAGTNQTVNASDKVTLDGSGSSDPDGNITKYSWMQTSGPAVTLADADTSTPSFIAPTVSDDTILKFSLVVTDDKGATIRNPTIVSVTVKAAIPKPPTSTIQNNTGPPLISSPSNHTNAPAANEYVFVRKWGSKGTGEGEFLIPFGIAIGSSGNVYVSDKGGDYGRDNPNVQEFNTNGKFITRWGSYGEGDGQFIGPFGIAVDSSGNVYVVDSENARIQKFDSNGKFITKWGSFGPGDTQFQQPRDVAVDSSDNVYVVDIYGVRKFDSNGKFITKWISRGSEDGQFNYPWGIAVDPSDNVYVADSINNRIQKFDSNGKFITKWGSEGTGDGQFSTPYDVAVDSYGNVYVVDSGNNRIQKFDSNGKFITKWGSNGTGDGQFDEPWGIVVDSSGNVYISDSENDRVQIFALSNNTSR